MRKLLLPILLVPLIALMTPALAIDNQQQLDDPVLQERYQRLGNELRCLVCQNQSIADSSAALAVDLRNQVRQMLLDGATDKEILDFMTARYGDFVRYRPAFKSTTWALWVGPFVVLLIGGFIVAAIVRRNIKFEPEESDD